jgi:hypothetical protein
MAFPAAPIVGQTHTEAGLDYSWSGNSWDLTTGTFQELIESTVNPTAGDVSDVGTIWRNTTTGDAWQYTSVTGGGAEWVQIVNLPSIQIGFNPTTQTSGASLVPGDLAIDNGTGTDIGVLRFWNGTSWNNIETFYDNTVAAMAGNPETTQDAIDALASRISLLVKGLAYFGTYNASTNTADFTAASGLTDGTLPAAGTTNQDSYLVVNVDGTPGTGPLAGTAMDKGDWIVSDGTSWTHLDISTNVDEFRELIDTPASYAGSAGRVVAVNATEDGLEFVEATDTHSIYSATSPTTRLGGAALQAGDRWINSTTLVPSTWSGTAWQAVSPVIVSTTAPTQTSEGLLWYNPSVSTLFIRDNLAAAWVGI